jgi:primosomal protein N' (replication factor Y)
VRAGCRVHISGLSFVLRPLSFISVAIPVPNLPLLTYAVPAGCDRPVRGARVLVPLGTRRVTGLVVGEAASPPEGEIRDLAEVLDDAAFLPEAVVTLCLWVADYYLSGPGDALAAAMPPGAWIETERVYQLTAPGRERAVTGAEDPRLPLLRQLTTGARSARTLARASGGRPIESVLRTLERDGLVERVTHRKGRASAFRTELVAHLTPAGATMATSEAWEDQRLTELQRRALSALAEAGTGVTATALREQRVSLASLRRLAARGLVHVETRVRERDPFSAGAAPAMAAVTHVLSAEQAAAFDTLSPLIDACAFQAALVHGVTGSGKTELYIRLARHACSRGRRVLVMVPEIALTPQVAALFRAVFGDRVAIQHSGLAAGERHDQWHRIRRGDIDVVVGTRSAVFAPLDNVGLIVVDEEHDGSYKQDENPRYNGRDVAVVRAREGGALALLGSATPAMETYYNAEQGRYARVVLARRVLDRPMARVEVVDLRAAYASEGPDVVLTRRLAEAVGGKLSAGQQIMLLLNRRGYATSDLCRQCGHILECPNCSVTLTVHRQRSGPARAVCHYCNYSLRVPTACVKCAAPYLEQVGFGTDRVLAEVERQFAGIRAARVDRDTMQKRGALGRTLDLFRRGDLDLLVGTQMIAKGHDFPRVTLVGVVSADLGLGLADFRAAERTFQLLTQVAGRAGRGGEAGEAIIQTLHPDHYSIKRAVAQDYEGFFADELRFRRAMAYPPTVGLTSLVVRGRTYAQAMQDASDLALRLQRDGHGAFALLGPAPAPLARLRGEYRAQMFLKTRHRGLTRTAIRTALADMPELGRRVTVDVDPMAML